MNVHEPAAAAAAAAAAARSPSPSAQFAVCLSWRECRLCLSELNIRALPIFLSKYPPRSRRPTHDEVQLKNSRLKNRKPRGHKGH